MARGNSKLGGRGRGREVEETGPNTAWSADGAMAPAAPSPARNILPGEPFEPVTAGFPAQRNPEPAPFAATTPAGWGFTPAPGTPAGVPGFAPDPGLFTGEAPTLTWPGEDTTGPMVAVPSAGPDPLDALQQYAGLPLHAAPAPDPTQLYQPSQVSAGLTGESGTTSTLTHPLGFPAAPVSGSAATSAAAPSAESGFADGGIFTGSEPFDGIPSVGQPHGLHDPFSPQLPTSGYVPQSSLEPLDVGAGMVGPFGDVLAEDEPEAGRRGGRRRAGSRRREAQPESADASRSGGKRAVALLGAVAVLGAAGYLGYSQLSGTDDPVASASAPAHPVAAHYALPDHLANLVQITPTQTKALTASYIQLAGQASPNLPKAQTATAYHPLASNQVVANVVVFRPSPATAFNALLGTLSRPAPGSATVPATPVAAGAAGGTMMCGSERGASTEAWCAWNSPKGMGFVQARGTADTAIPASYTRELRAFAER